MEQESITRCQWCPFKALPVRICPYAENDETENVKGPVEGPRLVVAEKKISISLVIFLAATAALMVDAISSLSQC